MNEIKANTEFEKGTEQKSRSNDWLGVNFPVGRYAPGGYSCKCCDCGCVFAGDKRAQQCLACAINAMVKGRGTEGDRLENLIAAARAHRNCGNEEHDPNNGKLNGFCVVCLIPWPCETAQRFLTPNA